MRGARLRVVILHGPDSAGEARRAAILFRHPLIEVELREHDTDGIAVVGPCFVSWSVQRALALLRRCAIALGVRLDGARP